MKNLLKKYFLFTIVFNLFLSLSVLGQERTPFDRGPDPNNPMHRELIELFEELPNIPGMSEVLELLVPSYKSCLLYTSPSPRDRG